MITIIFEPHSTTFDNEAHLASGWEDAALSPKGKEQAIEMGKRYAKQTFDVIFCSDLQRSYKTANIAFGNKYPIETTDLLRECNYGNFNRRSVQEVEQEKPNRIDTPFPNGESYTQSTARIKEFLSDLAKQYSGKKILIIGHRATQYGLEHLINGKSLHEVISTPWKWQPGWTYNFDFMKS